MLVTPRAQGKLDGPLGRHNRRLSRAAAARYAVKGLWVPGASVGYWPTADQTLPHVLDLSGFNQHLFNKWAATNNPVPTVNPSGIAVEHTSGANSFLTGLFREFLPFSVAALYLPATLLCVTRPTANPGSLQFIFSLLSPADAPNASPKFVLYRNGTTFTAELRHSSSSSQGVSSTGWSSGSTYAIAATTRSRTDHEIVVCNLDTGAIGYGTNSTDSGQAARNPTDVALGAYYYTGTPTVYSNLYDGQTNLCAFMARGLSREELTALVRSPFDLIETSPTRSIASIYSPPASVTADLAVTLADVTLSATGDVPNAGVLSETLGAVSLDATGEPETAGFLTETLGALSLDSLGEVDRIGELSETLGAVTLGATAQVGDGVIGVLGDVGIALNPLELTGEGDVSLYGDLAETLAGISMDAFAISGTNGPFTRRPFLVLN